MATTNTHRTTQTGTDPQSLMQVDDVAHRLNVTTGQVRTWVNAGLLQTLPRTSEGSRIYITSTALHNFLNASEAVSA